MLYIFLKYLAQCAFAIYHRKVYRIDVENLPKDGPVLLALNHPGAFLDACVISAYSPRPLYYLTRGDMFKKGIATWFLEGTHQIPIYRADHGIGKLRENRGTFAQCYDNLAEGKVILIFPEAKADIEKKLRPLYKGAARIVFGANDSHGKLPVIVPVGFTFSDPRYFGYDAFYAYGEPISVEKYLDTYQNDPQKAYQIVMDEIRDSLRSLMIYLESDAGERVFNDAVRLLEVPPPSFPPLSANKEVYNWQRKMAEKVNDLSMETVDELQTDIDNIKDILGNAGLNLNTYPWLADQRIGGFGLLMTAPFILVGSVIGYVPYKLAYTLAVSKVRREPFLGPIKSMLGFIVHWVFFMVVGVILSIFVGWIGWLYTFFGAMLVYFSLQYHRKPNFGHWLRWQRMSGADKEKLSNLRDKLRVTLDPSL